MPARPKLGELLVMAGAIDQIQLGAALANQRQFGGPLGATLVRMGFLDEESLVRTLARQLKLPIAWLRGKWVDQEVLDLVPAELALKHRCLPLNVNDDAHGKLLYLAMQDPGDLEAMDAVRFRVGHNVSPVLAAPSELEEALQRHYESGDSEGRFSASRPEVQQVPELLMFELKAQAATPDTDLAFEFGTGPSDASLMSSQAVLSALTQLLTLLMQKGIISREEVAERFRAFLPTDTATHPNRRASDRKS
jgi:type IV pilus assembly protein PilB